MPIIDPAKLEGVHRPEILFAWVAAVGTPLEHLSRVLGDALGTHGYHPRTIKLSDFLKGFTLPTPPARCGGERVPAPRLPDEPRERAARADGWR